MSNGTTMKELPMAMDIFPRRCWGMISGDLTVMMAKIMTYRTPIMAVHITIHIGMNTIYREKDK